MKLYYSLPANLETISLRKRKQIKKQESAILSVFLLSRKCKYSIMDKSEYVNARLTSFLKKDNSFLTPWSWNRKACENETRNSKEKEYIIFPPGSYFSYGDKVIFYFNDIIIRLFWDLVA
jgi:hypothetical protein